MPCPYDILCCGGSEARFGGGPFWWRPLGLCPVCRALNQALIIICAVSTMYKALGPKAASLYWVIVFCITIGVGAPCPVLRSALSVTSQCVIIIICLYSLYATYMFTLHGFQNTSFHHVAHCCFAYIRLCQDNQRGWINHANYPLITGCMHSKVLHFKNSSKT